MIVLRQLAALALGLALAMACTNTFAAESGTLGEDSGARFTISLRIEPSLEITTATDIGINIRDRSVDAVYEQSFCVRGSADHRYTVTATGDTNSNGRFVLRNASNQTLPFTVAYRGDPRRSAPDELTPGTPSTTYSILPRGESCSGVTYFIVTFRSEDLELVEPGLYRGSLTFLVSPV